MPFRACNHGCPRLGVAIRRADRCQGAPFGVESCSRLGGTSGSDEGINTAAENVKTRSPDPRLSVERESAADSAAAERSTPRATLPLTPGGLSTRERESSRGLASDGESNPDGCSRTPRCGLRNGERRRPSRPAAKSRGDAALGDPARWPTESQPCKPNDRRNSATVEKAPRAGLEPAT